jgi:hypothetical protein
MLYLSRAFTPLEYDQTIILVLLPVDIPSSCTSFYAFRSLFSLFQRACSARSVHRKMALRPINSQHCLSLYILSPRPSLKFLPNQTAMIRSGRFMYKSKIQSVLFLFYVLYLIDSGPHEHAIYYYSTVHMCCYTYIGVETRKTPQLPQFLRGSVTDGNIWAESAGECASHTNASRGTWYRREVASMGYGEVWNVWKEDQCDGC